jgi:hypothetical protein
MKKFLATITMLMSLSVWAGDNVLIVGSYGDAGTSIRTELEAVGHTVTNVNSLPVDLSNINQIWDLRINDAISVADQTAYDTFLQNSGYLYLAGENAGFATRNNSISTFTSTLGGGTISVGGSPSNAQIGNNLYFTDGSTVSFIAAARIDNTGGTGRVLASDADGNATAMIWIGNAGDLAGSYNGTVVVIADINWTQSNFYDTANERFLEELIAGIVAGTTSGTISGNGTGTGIGGGGAPTVVSTTPGTDIVASTSTVGAATVVVTQANPTSAVVDHVQTVTPGDITTTTTTPTTVTTCTTPTTVTTYSDNTTTTSNGTTVCSSSITTSTTSTTVSGGPSISARADQFQTLVSINQDQSFTLGIVEGVILERSDSKLNNNYTGSADRYSVGYKTIKEENTIGFGYNRVNYKLSHNDGVGSSTTDHVVLQLERNLNEFTLMGNVNYASTNYSYSRTLGPYSNRGMSDGKDYWGHVRAIKNHENIRPFVGITVGARTVDQLTESGSELTKLHFDRQSQDYSYGVAGVDANWKLLQTTITANTNGDYLINVGMNHTVKDKVHAGIYLSRLDTKIGHTDSIRFGLNVKF